MESNNINIQYSDTGNLVYFYIDVKEMFGVTLSQPGMMNAIRIAMRESKSVIPDKTGLLRRSYSLLKDSNHRVMIFFDPAKIVGANRRGQTVKTYYPKYLAEKAKTFGWLDIVIRRFLMVLIAEVKILKKKQDTINIATALALYKLFIESLKQKIKKKGVTSNEKQFQVLVHRK